MQSLKDYSKNAGLYSQRDGKPLKIFQQETDVIQLISEQDHSGFSVENRFRT